ncbi:MAG: hypothetical protein E7066_06205 [Lentimicrobiaceae bacterium]|nr:hypothetical protein [Lentimicrobiaceae bacterium]
MKEFRAALSAFIVGILIVLLGVSGRNMLEHSEYNGPVRDTVYDTITFYKPVPKDSTVIKYVTVKLHVTDDKENNFPITDDAIQSDSSDVIIPITQKVYTDDSTYTAYVSGYQPSLDSLLFMRRTETIIETIRSPTREFKKRWSVGVQVGYGITIDETPQFIPYIGLGVTYNLINL